MSSYLSDLIPLFKAVTPDQGREIAHDLASAASEALARRSSTIEFGIKYAGTTWEVAGRAHPLSATMVSDPWQAYMLSRHDEESAFYILESGIEGILATMPNEYKLDALPRNRIGAHADSLVSHLVNLIDYAEKELLVVAPYWSVQGIEDLRRRMRPGRKEGLHVTLVTDANAKPADIDGANAFKSLMQGGLGTQITHLEPIEMDSGRVPMLHAKVVVADKKRAYVGSANFSQNGLSQSIEMGVALAGTPALQLHSWFTEISSWLVASNT